MAPSPPPVAFLAEERAEFGRCVDDCVRNGSSSEAEVGLYLSTRSGVESPNLMRTSFLCPPKQTLKATPYPIPNSSGTTALLWYLPSSIDHPLRSLVGSAPFILATAVPQKKAATGLVSRKKKKADEEVVDIGDVSVPLTRVGAIDVDGKRETGIGGMAGSAENGSSSLVLDGFMDSDVGCFEAEALSVVNSSSRCFRQLPQPQFMRSR